MTPLALQNGEVACTALADPRRGRPAGRLQWTVGPDETNAIEDLRDKIKSKMDIAKLLGGFITLVLGGVVLAPGRLDELSRGGDRWAVYVAAVSFLIAIGLYLGTMYAYDTVLMPKRYWGEGAPGGRTPRWLVRRPPSDAAWVLYQNMLHVWTFRIHSGNRGGGNRSASPVLCRPGTRIACGSDHRGRTCRRHGLWPLASPGSRQPGLGRVCSIRSFRDLRA